jgi:hypothetical protein
MPRHSRIWRTTSGAVMAASTRIGSWHRRQERTSVAYVRRRRVAQSSSEMSRPEDRRAIGASGRSEARSGADLVDRDTECRWPSRGEPRPTNTFRSESPCSMHQRSPTQAEEARAELVHRHQLPQVGAGARLRSLLRWPTTPGRDLRVLSFGRAFGSARSTDMASARQGAGEE